MYKSNLSTTLLKFFHRLTFKQKLNADLKNHIIEQANDLNPQPDIDLWVSEAIGKLNRHINVTNVLKDSDVNYYLDQLLGHFTTSLFLCIDPRTNILRGRPYNSYKKELYTRDLSYIPINKSSNNQLGRMNKKGNSIYYGCVHFDEHWGGVDVAFSETHANDGQTVNVLRSATSAELKVYIPGIYDHIRRQQRPWFINERTFEYFSEVYEYQKTIFSDEVFVAYQLCDAFFSDIFRRKESVNLYQVTSQIANFILNDTSADGIIYASVQSEGSPLVALKTSSVDRKLTHNSASVYNIKKSFGYGLYKATLEDSGTVSGENITWQ